jgi:hypothetical protein
MPVELKNINNQMSAAEYCRVVFALHRQLRSGVLSIQSEEHTHTLYWVSGECVGYQSTFPSFDWRTLLLKSPSLPTLTDLDKYHSQKALIEHNILNADQLSQHQSYELSQAIQLPLRWRSVKWSFHPHEIDSRSIDPNLLMSLPVLPVLWKGVLKHVAVRKSAFEHHSILANDTFGRWFHAFGFPEENRLLPTWISKNKNLSEIEKKFGIFKELPSIIWVLTACELLTFQVATPSKKQSDKRLTSSPVQAITHPHMVVSEYKKRMGRDFYSFLGLSEDVTVEKISIEVRKLIRRWHTAANSSQPEQENIQKLSELCMCLYTIWWTLIIPNSKLDYDNALSTGQAPSAAYKLSGFAISKTSVMDEIHEALKKERFQSVVGLIEPLLYGHLLKPELLMVLGFSYWKMGAVVKGLVLIESAMLMEVKPSLYFYVDQILKEPPPEELLSHLIRLKQRLEHLISLEPLSENTRTVGLGL